MSLLNHLAVLACVALPAGSLFAIEYSALENTPEALTRLQQQDALETQRLEVLGLDRVLYSGDKHVMRLDGTLPIAGAETAAGLLAILQEVLRPVVGSASDAGWTVTQVNTTSYGRTFIRAQQTVNGLQVFAGGFIVEASPDLTTVYSVRGNLIAGAALSSVPAIDGPSAARLVEESEAGLLADAASPILGYIVDRNIGARLAWMVYAADESGRPDGRYLYVVDALTGDTLESAPAHALATTVMYETYNTTKVTSLQCFGRGVVQWTDPDLGVWSEFKLWGSPNSDMSQRSLFYQGLFKARIVNVSTSTYFAAEAFEDSGYCSYLSNIDGPLVPRPTCP
jgi:Fungalysin/Thermolysin Propeptide Motif